MHSAPTIYLDNNATTKVAPEVLEVMMPAFTDLYGNASSMHHFGGQMKKYIDTAREQVATLLNAHPEEIIFTSCGTESDNTAFHSAYITQPNKHIYITTRVEHSAVLHAAQELEQKGKQVVWLNVDEEGQINVEEFEDFIKKNAQDIALVSMMYANNETGTIFPIARISEILKQYNVLFHVDAVQAIGKQIIDLQETKIDFLALSGHKIHAPKGIGVLYVRKGIPFRPLLVGGHQEFSKRAGTENVPYIIGLGKACEMAQEAMNTEKGEMARLRDMLEKGLLETIPSIKINGDKEHRLPNTSNISIKNIEGEALLLMLNMHGICASSGSACTSGSLEPSHVLRAMGVPYNYAHGSLRFSFSRYNTYADVKKVLDVLPGIVQTLRDMSPYQD